METRVKAIENKDANKMERLHKEIQQRVCRDKQTNRLEKLKEMDEHGYKWDGIKQQKTMFTHKFCKFKDENGHRVSINDYAHKAADYLQNKQWKKPDKRIPNKLSPNKVLPQGLIKDEDFDIDELNFVIGKMAKNKTPGPDEVRNELIGYLNRDNRLLVLEMINEDFRTGKLEEDLNLANVVSIYPKGG